MSSYPSTFVLEAQASREGVLALKGRILCRPWLMRNSVLHSARPSRLAWPPRMSTLFWWTAWQAPSGTERRAALPHPPIVEKA
jgi:hypothetical protein